MESSVDDTEEANVVVEMRGILGWKKQAEYVKYRKKFQIYCLETDLVQLNY